MKKIIAILIAVLLLVACNETPMATSALEEQTISSSAAAADIVVPPTEASSSSVAEVSSSSSMPALYIVEIGNIGADLNGCGSRYINGSVGADSISNVAKVHNALIDACGEQVILWTSSAKPLATFKEWVNNDTLYLGKVSWPLNAEGGSNEEVSKIALICRVENYGTALQFYTMKEDGSYIYIYVKPAS